MVVQTLGLHEGLGAPPTFRFPLLLSGTLDAPVHLLPSGSLTPLLWILHISTQTATPVEMGPPRDCPQVPLFLTQQKAP